MTGQQLLVGAITRLKAAGVDDPARDARRLLAQALQVAPGRLTLHLADLMTEAQAQLFEQQLTRRAAREPVSHLVGTRAFYGLEFAVTPDVLDPRPETETLVEQCLAQRFSSVLDLGTGSGCILIALLANAPHARGTGTDQSAAALRIAAQNAEALGVADRAVFEHGDWFEAVATGARFDLIVSNPPYIAIDEMARLSPELSYEPRRALTDEADGLTAYRVITQGAGVHLTPRGRLAVEIGPTQADAVSDLFRTNGFSEIAVHTDLDGRDRVVTGVSSPQMV